MNELKYDAEAMPMKIVNIPNFERRNPQIAINVIKYIPSSPRDRNAVAQNPNASERGLVFKHPNFDVIYNSLQREITPQTKVINLLLIEEDEYSHYLAITNIERLLNCHPNPNRCDVQIRGKICERCLRIFSKKSSLDKHTPLCES